jgi:hypothetical protein
MNQNKNFWHIVCFMNFTTHTIKVNSRSMSGGFYEKGGQKGAHATAPGGIPKIPQEPALPRARKQGDGLIRWKKLSEKERGGMK